MTIEHSAAKVLGTHLISTGVFTLPSQNKAWPLSISSMPNSPDRMGTIYNTNGVIDGRQMGGVTISHPGVLIRFRGRDDDEIAKKIEEVFAALDATVRAIVTIATKSYRIQSVRRTTTPMALGPEVETGRLLYTVNGLVTFQEV